MKKFKLKLERLHLSLSKEIIKILIVDVVLIGCLVLTSFLLKSWLYIGIGGGFAAILTILYFSRYDGKIDEIIKKLLLI